MDADAIAPRSRVLSGCALNCSLHCGHSHDSNLSEVYAAACYKYSGAMCSRSTTTFCTDPSAQPDQRPVIDRNVEVTLVVMQGRRGLLCRCLCAPATERSKKRPSQYTMWHVAFDSFIFSGSGCSGYGCTLSACSASTGPPLLPDSRPSPDLQKNRMC